MLTVNTACLTNVVAIQSLTHCIIIDSKKLTIIIEEGHLACKKYGGMVEVGTG